VGQGSSAGGGNANYARELPLRSESKTPGADSGVSAVRRSDLHQPDLLSHRSPYDHQFLAKGSELVGLAPSAR
jgi:hypothetical protein